MSWQSDAIQTIRTVIEALDTGGDPFVTTTIMLSPEDARKQRPRTVVVVPESFRRDPMNRCRHTLSVVILLFQRLQNDEDDEAAQETMLQDANRIYEALGDNTPFLQAHETINRLSPVEFVYSAGGKSNDLAMATFRLAVIHTE